MQDVIPTSILNNIYHYSIYLFEHWTCHTMCWYFYIISNVSKCYHAKYLKTLFCSWFYNVRCLIIHTIFYKFQIFPFMIFCVMDTQLFCHPWWQNSILIMPSIVLTIPFVMDMQDCLQGKITLIILFITLSNFIFVLTTYNSSAIQDGNTKVILHSNDGNDTRHPYNHTFFLQHNPK